MHRQAGADQTPSRGEGRRTPLLIVEQLHLLLLAPNGTVETVPAYRAYAETAALLVDLAVADAVTVSLGAETILAAREQARPEDSPVLRFGWSALKSGGSGSIPDLLRRPELDPGSEVEESLVGAGILERSSGGIIGFRRTRTPALDPRPEEEIRTRLASALAGEARATQTDVVLLSLLDAAADAPRILREESGGMSRDQFTVRVKEIGAGSELGQTVTAATQEAAAAAAVITAVLVPTIITGVFSV